MYDYHSHTHFSDDCSIPMDQMIQSAIDKGIRELAITDHFDPGYPEAEYPFILDFPRYHRALDQAKETYQGKINICKGIEIGIMEGQYQPAHQAIESYPYDFVIGSFHCLRDVELHSLDVSTVDQVQLGHDFYHYILNCLHKYDNYDVLGHFTLIDRYIGQPALDYTPYMDEIGTILKRIIDQGKGLEINTSHHRYQTGLPLPRREILEYYFHLGGRIITFGSDAHEPQRLGDHFHEAVSMARDIGFTHFARYTRRVPSFHSLSEDFFS